MIKQIQLADIEGRDTKTVMIERAFKLSRPVSNRYLIDKLAEGDFALTDKRTKWVPTRNKRVKVGYAFHSDKTWLDMFVYIDGKTAGAAEFDILRGMELEDDLAEVFGKAKWYVPHVAFLPEYRGLGYASFIYSLIISRGIGLVTEDQTEDAHNMWKRVAAKTGANLYYWNPKKQKFTDTKDRNALQVMTIRKPLQ